MEGNNSVSSMGFLYKHNCVEKNNTKHPVSYKSIAFKDLLKRNVSQEKKCCGGKLPVLAEIMALLL